MKPNAKFTLTKKDFKIEYLIGHGNGGQHRQKAHTACRVTHIITGVNSYCQDHREQHRNLKTAFERVCQNPFFKAWCEQRLREIEEGVTLEQKIDELMKPENLKIEYYEP